MIILMTIMCPLGAQLSTYDYPEGTRESPFYSVMVKQGDSQASSFVHVSECPDGPFAGHKIWITEQDRSMSFTNFSFDGQPVQVTVTKLFGTPGHDVQITPKRYGILIDSFDGRSVTFTMDRPEYVSVRFVCDDNTDEYNNIKNGMMVFADLPEENPPEPGDPGVVVYGEDSDLADAGTIYFRPGLYDLFDRLPDGRLIVHDDQSIYIAGGAYVYGTLFGAGTHNVMVRGRGVLSGGKHEFHYDGMQQLAEFAGSNTILNARRGSRHTIEGITLIESVNHTLVVPGNSLVKDVKFISWACNNDGLRADHGSVIDHVFMKLCDDYFYATQEILIKRSVLWPMFNGGILQLGWGAHTAGGTTFRDNEIINPEWDWIGSNTGVVASQVKPGADLSGLLFENVHIQGNINALAHLDFALVPGREYTWKGSIHDFTFRNVEVDGRQIWYSSRGWDDYERLEWQLSSDYNIDPENPAIGGKSIIRGMENDRGEKVRVENITFENLKINGEWVTEENHEKYFDIDPNTTRNIRFLLDPSKMHTGIPGPTSLEAYAAEGVGARLDRSEVRPASLAGWLGEGGQVEFTLDVPAAGEYELRYGVVPLFGPATLSYAIGKKRTGSIEVDGLPGNAFRNMKRVYPETFTLDQGSQKVKIRVEKGLCIPDLLEVAPVSDEPGTPEYHVFTHWHGVLRREGSNWKTAELAYGEEAEGLYFGMRGGGLDGCELKVYNLKGKLLISTVLKGREPVPLDDLGGGVYTAVISDGSTFSAAKQFIIY